jgi:uncharacterized Zn-finger protein
MEAEWEELGEGVKEDMNDNLCDESLDQDELQEWPLLRKLEIEGVEKIRIKIFKDKPVKSLNKSDTVEDGKKQESNKKVESSKRTEKGKTLNKDVNLSSSMSDKMGTKEKRRVAHKPKFSLGLYPAGVSGGEAAGFKFDSDTKCSMCIKACSTIAALKRHMKVHSKVKPNDKPYKCKECNKSFARENTLKRHVKVDCGKQSYTCTLCNKAFSGPAAKGNLKRHLIAKNKHAHGM